MIRIFVGYDSRQVDAYRVLRYSLESRCSSPLSIAALKLRNLDTILTRERHPLQSTEFSFSRFLCPYLCDYEGWSIFMDCDILNLRDIAQLWKLRDERYAIQVVKHNHIPRRNQKFLGQVQSTYACKNWSSLMLINNGRCRNLTPDYINTASGLDLHQFRWLDDNEIGVLPQGWNHLVGISSVDGTIHQLHYTDGGPWFQESGNCEFAEVWWEEHKRMSSVNSDAPSEGMRQL